MADKNTKPKKVKKSTDTKRLQTKLCSEDLKLAQAIFKAKHGEFVKFDLTGCVQELIHDKANQLRITQEKRELKDLMPTLCSYMLEFATLITDFAKNNSIQMLKQTIPSRPVGVTSPAPASPTSPSRPLSRAEVDEVGDKVFELDYEPESGPTKDPD